MADDPNREAPLSAKCPHCGMKPLEVSLLTVLAPTGGPWKTSLILNQVICGGCTALLASQIMGEVAEFSGKHLPCVRNPKGVPVRAGDPRSTEADRATPADAAADMGAGRASGPLWTPGAGN